MLARLAPLPLHVGIDNAAVVHKANRLLQHLSDDPHYTPSLPSGLQNDGDLWAHIHDAFLERGIHSVRVTKVRGHAKWSECQSDDERWHKRGNDNADRAARDAHEPCHGKPFVDLCRAYEERLEHYTLQSLLTYMH